MSSGFVHLHQHTEYSLLDGMTRPEESVEIAASHGQNAVAITDHGVCGGFLRFQKAADKHGIKPLFGCEMYFTEDIVEDKADKKAERFHMITLARNNEGLENLYKMQKKAWTEGFYYKPRIDWNMLEAHSSGLIATSSCMGGIVAKCIRDGDEGRAEMIVDRMNKMFDRFYIELQPWNAPELNASLIAIAEAKEIPLVGTIDCHYPTQKHKDIEEVLLCVGMWPSFNAPILNHVKANWEAARKKGALIDKVDFLYPDRRLRFYDHDHWVMSEAEVREAFRNAGIDREDIIENTLEVAEECNARIPTGQSLLPKFDKKRDSNELLQDIADFKMEEMGLTTDTYKERLAEELAIIHQLNFSDYFLVVWDVVNWAKNNNIFVGAGRGSAAGSLVAYVLGITDINPIEHNLIFWRFINPERLDYPDIDLDFEDRRREDVKQYMRDRWGAENVAGISTYGAFKAKAVVKDVARVFGVPLAESNAVTKHFNTMEEFLASKNTLEYRDRWPEVQRCAEVLYERVRQSGAHAAGVVISNRPLDEICPIETRDDKKSATGRVEVTAYDMNECQDLGLIKMDFLGLNTLSVVHDTVDAIKERHGIDVIHMSQTLDDPAVFKRFSEADTVGIFQTESSAYKNLLLKMGIDNFVDLAASNALVRPGALMTQTDTYIRRKKGEEPISFEHPILEPITRETYGTFVYQEQIMETVVHLAGFSWRESDTLRKIIGKKKDLHEFDEWQKKFIDGATRYISTSKAQKMWEDFVKFSSYAFVKAHAVSYSKLSYQTMWLKHYYPTEFMWALLRNEDQSQNIATYLLECVRMGIDIHPPHVNSSKRLFELEGNGIRFGLSNIAGLGPAAIEEIMEKAPFASLEEFQNRCMKRKVKATAIEALDKVGAFEGMHQSQYDHRRYYFEYLNYPVDLNRETDFEDKIIPCSEFVEDEGRLGVVKAIVRSTKRTPTYFRIEFEDSTGSFSVFASQNVQVEQGDFLVAMVGKKRLHEFLYVYELDEVKADPFYKFLVCDVLEPWKKCYDVPNTGGFDKAKTLAHVVSVAKFKTKKGDWMANALMWDGERLENVVVFPRQFAENAMRLKPWTTVVVKTEKLDDGGITIQSKGLLEVEEFCKIVGV